MNALPRRVLALADPPVQGARGQLPAWQDALGLYRVRAGVVREPSDGAAGDCQRVLQQWSWQIHGQIEGTVEGGAALFFLAWVPYEVTDAFQIVPPVLAPITVTPRLPTVAQWVTWAVDVFGLAVRTSSNQFGGLPSPAPVTVQPWNLAWVMAVPREPEGPLRPPPPMSLVLDIASVRAGKVVP